MPTSTHAAPAELTLSCDAGVPAPLCDRVRTRLQDSEVGGDLRISPDQGRVFARWVYAVCAPFPTLADGVRWADIEAFWAGKEDALVEVSGDGIAPALYVTTDTLSVLHGLLGEPSREAPIHTAADDALVDQAWAERPHAWAIVPFDRLDPRWKVLAVDGLSPLDKGVDVESYPLTVRVGATGAASDASIAILTADGAFVENRDVSRITTLVMTGVTALVRATAERMEKKGVLYPAEHIGDLLRSADVTHISNEIPFAKECPPPDPYTTSLVFCSDPRYIELLRFVGTDVVELTGNHFQDYGSEATLDTLKMYRKEGWPYYGGGADLEDASRPATVEHNGNRLSFIGCNPVGPESAIATDDRPGAAPCNFEYMHSELGRLREEGDVPIATWQYWEFYWYEPTPQQQLDFRGMADAGAAIVSGSQAHHPQAIEFYNGSFIHYGLGNLFFDQMQSLETRQQVVDRHIIYEGRHISTELHTFMLEDYSQPRRMTLEEREQLLSAIFAASGW